MSFSSSSATRVESMTNNSTTLEVESILKDFFRSQCKKQINEAQALAAKFRDAKIDGEALLLMNTDDMVKYIGLAPGLAVILYACLPRSSPVSSSSSVALIRGRKLASKYPSDIRTRINLTIINHRASPVLQLDENSVFLIDFGFNGDLCLHGREAVQLGLRKVREGFTISSDNKIDKVYYFDSVTAVMSFERNGKPETRAALLEVMAYAQDYDEAESELSSAEPTSPAPDLSTSSFSSSSRDVIKLSPACHDPPQDGPKERASLGEMGRMKLGIGLPPAKDGADDYYFEIGS